MISAGFVGALVAIIGFIAGILYDRYLYRSRDYGIHNRIYNRTYRRRVNRLHDMRADRRR